MAQNEQADNHPAILTNGTSCNVLEINTDGRRFVFDPEQSTAERPQTEEEAVAAATQRFKENMKLIDELLKDQKDK